MPLDSISMAKRTPKKKVVTVAQTAQTRVQPSTGKKVPAKSPVSTLPNALKPVQEKPIGCLES